MLAVLAVAAVYYGLFYFSSRQVGMNDPDRYFHLAIANLQAQQGLLRSLPQADDLGWGRYFPDKEFLFHVLTWLGQRLGGYRGVLAVVPLLGAGLLAILYVESARVLRPAVAALLVVAAVFLTTMFAFRLSLLRPHLLAIGFLMLLVVAILRGRAWLVAFACAGFALSYHAYYLVLLVVGLAMPFSWPRLDRKRMVLATSGGLSLGIVLNPYFPSNLVMSWIHLQLALGLGLPSGLELVPELQPLSVGDFVQSYALVPLALLLGGVAVWQRGRATHPGTAAIGSPELPFLFVLGIATALLGFKSPRAMEYAVPIAVLLAAHGLAALHRRWLAPGFLVLLGLAQLGTATAYYRDIWSESQAGDSGWYLMAITALPPEAAGHKVFNCEWTAGAYLLYWRPDVRFVDLLEPSFLWRVSPSKYLARQSLLAGRDPAPASTLRRVFHADYVMCAATGLRRQMDQDSRSFESLPTPPGPLKLYRLLGPVEPSDGVAVPAATSARPRTD